MTIPTQAVLVGDVGRPACLADQERCLGLALGLQRRVRLTKSREPFDPLKANTAPDPRKAL